MDSNGIQEPPTPMMGYDDEDEEEDYGEEEDKEMESVGDDKEEQGSDDEDGDNGDDDLDVDLEANQPEKASAEAVKVAESCIAGEASEARVLMPSKSVSAD